MKRKRLFGRTLRWTWAATAAILFHVALYWSVALTRDSGQKLRRQTRQFTEVQYFDAETAERSRLLSQQMSLFDPRPLLLPTEWNAANARGYRDLLQEEGEIFPEYTPLFELEDGNYIEDFGNVPATYDQLAAAQVEFAFPPFDQLGRAERSGAGERAEGVTLTLRDPSDGRELSRTIIYNDETRAIAAAWPGWEPLTLIANVENSFQVGGLTVVASSGFDEADARLRGLASLNFARFGWLRDGVYLVEIIP